MYLVVCIQSFFFFLPLSVVELMNNFKLTSLSSMTLEISEVINTILKTANFFRIYYTGADIDMLLLYQM